MGLPAVLCGSPSSLQPIFAVSPGGPAAKAQQLWVASGNSDLRSSMNTLAFPWEGAWPTVVMKRLLVMVSVIRCFCIPGIGYRVWDIFQHVFHEALCASQRYTSEAAVMQHTSLCFASQACIHCPRTFLCRGPSNSVKKTPCQVPRAGRPEWMISWRLQPSSEDLMWASLLPSR